MLERIILTKPTLERIILTKPMLERIILTKPTLERIILTKPMLERIILTKSTLERIMLVRTMLVIYAQDTPKNGMCLFLSFLWWRTQRVNFATWKMYLNVFFLILAFVKTLCLECLTWWTLPFRTQLKIEYKC